MIQKEGPGPLQTPATTTNHLLTTDNRSAAQSTGQDRQDMVTVPVVEYQLLLADAQRWRRITAWEADQQVAWDWEPEWIRARRLISVENCAACGTAVEMPHPWPRWAIAQLPDLGWIRCSGCQRKQRGAA